MAQSEGAVVRPESDNLNLQQVVANFKQAMQNIQNSFLNVSKIIAESPIVKQVADIGKAAIQAGIEYESAFAGIRKTVDATDAEFRKISDGIRQMSKEIPTTAKEIAGIAEAAGQLGIQNESILSFTRVMSDLGVATDMSANEAATALAELANIIKMPQENFDRLGSTIVGLGNNFATSEKPIVDMSLRLSAAASQAGFTEADILGLSTALSSVGVNAEAGGGAMTRVLNNMNTEVLAGGKGLEGFASVAGMTAEEFKQAWGENAPQAFDKFIQGLGQAGEEGESMSAILEELGIKETSATTALMSLAGSGDLLTRALDVANTAWDENVALTNEASQRYQTLESQLAIFKNGLTDIGITIKEALNDSLKGMVATATEAIDKLSTAFQSPEMQQALAAIGQGLEKLVTIIADIAVTVIPIFVKALGMIVQVLDTLSPLIVAVAAGFAAFKIITAITVGITAATTAMQGLSAAMVISRAATAALNAIMSANPIVLVVTAIVALVAGLAVLHSKLTEVTGASKELSDENKKAIDDANNLSEAMNSGQGAHDQRLQGLEAESVATRNLSDQIYALAAQENLSMVEKQQLALMVDQLNEKVPALNLAYDNETNSLNQTSEATLALIASKEEEAQLQAYAERSYEITKQRAEAEIELMAIEQQRIDTEKQLAANAEDSTMSYGERKGAAKELKKDLEALDETEKTLLESDKNLEAQQVILKDKTVEYSVEVQARQEKEAAAAEAQEAAAAAMEKQSTAIDGAKMSLEDYASSLGLTEDEQKEFQSTVKSLYKDWENASTSMFKKISTDSDESVEKMISTLKHNADATKEWSANIKKLVKMGVDEGIIQTLVEGGPATAGAAKELTKATKEEVKEMNANFKESADGVVEAIDTSMTALGQSYSSNSEVPEAARAFGEKTATENAHGIEDGTPAVVASAEKLNRDAIDAAQKVGIKEEFFKIGTLAPAGLASGMKSGESGVTNAAKWLATSTVNATNRKLEVNSPSRVFKRIGLYIDEGWANGIEEGGKFVEEAVSGVAKKGIKGVDEWLKKKKEKTEVSAAEEIKIWESVAQQYSVGTEQRAQADAKSLAAVEEALKKRKEITTVSLGEEAAIWLEAAQRYEEGTLARNKADEQSYNVFETIVKKRKELGELTALEEIALWNDVGLQYAENSQQRIDVDNAQVESIKNYVKESELSINEEIMLWKQATELYKEGTAARTEADNQYFEAKKLMEEQVTELEMKYLDAVDARAKQIADSVGGLFSGITKKEGEEINKTDLWGGLVQQTSQLETWLNSVATLTSKGIDEGFIAEVQKVGVSAQQELNALNSMTDTELTAYVQMWKSKNELARRQAEEELKGMKDDTYKQIKEMTKGVDDIFVDSVDDANKSGADLIKSLAKGMESEESTLYKTAENIATKAMEAIQKVAGGTSATSKSTKAKGGNAQGARALTSIDALGYTPPEAAAGYFGGESLTQRTLGNLTSLTDAIPIRPAMDAKQLLKAQNGLYALQQNEQTFAKSTGNAISGRGRGAFENNSSQTSNLVVNIQLDHAMFADKEMVDRLAQEVSTRVARETQWKNRYIV